MELERNFSNWTWNFQLFPDITELYMKYSTVFLHIQKFHGVVLRQFAQTIRCLIQDTFSMMNIYFENLITFPFVLSRFFRFRIFFPVKKNRHAFQPKTVIFQCVSLGDVYQKRNFRMFKRWNFIFAYTRVARIKVLFEKVLS